MTTLFIAILNMSITASYVALAVIMIRLFLKKVPKVFSYSLWLAVLIRLVFPSSFNSVFSFLSFLKPTTQANSETMEYIPFNIGLMQTPAVDLGSSGINQLVNSPFPPASPYTSINPMQITMEIAGFIWGIGAVMLLIYCVISYLKVINNVRTATLVRAGIFETDRITTPFVCGFIKPRIYVPTGLSDDELSYILAHEQTHIQRLDYLIKPFSFLVLIVHWFNPLMWISFSLMSKDMEMSCDENVIRKMGSGVKGGYSKSLLTLSVTKRGLMSGSPLAFGESHVQSRIKNVLNYKKPRFSVVVATCIATVIVIMGFTANPANKQDLSENTINELATVWANALITRDGEPRYEMMSTNMKEQFKQEQIVRSGENWNFNIGVSSPWVVDFEIIIDDNRASITYLTQSSEPASYKTEEILTIGEENGKPIVTDYKTVYEDQLIKSGSTD